MQVVEQEQSCRALVEGVRNSDRTRDNCTGTSNEFVADAHPIAASGAGNLGPRVAVRYSYPYPDAFTDRVCARFA